jgi:hypothetical protein
MEPDPRVGEAEEEAADGWAAHLPLGRVDSVSAQNAKQQFRMFPVSHAVK